MAAHLSSPPPRPSLRSRCGRFTTQAVFGLAVFGLAAVGCSSGEDTVASSAVPASNAAAGDVDASSATPATSSTTSEVDDAASGRVEQPTFELVGDIVLDTAEMNDLIAFVVDTTGRPFLRPPVIVSQTPEAFIDGLLEMTPEEEAEALEQSALLARAYQVLGLSEQTPTELFANIRTFASSPDGILGYYDPDTDELYVPNLLDPDADIDEFRGLLVHELTHALDGQHVDLAAVLDDVESAADAFFDSAFADRALVEGRAVAVQQLFLEAEGVTPAVPDAPSYDVPLAYVSSLVLPYQVGGGWVMGNGGPAGSWELYDEELPSSETMLFGPAAGEEIDVASPSASPDLVELSVIDEGTVGATGIFVWLAGNEVGAGPAVTAAVDAAMGWGGDGYVLVGDEETTCIIATFVGDTEEDLLEIESAFTSWADAAPAGSTRSVTSANEAVEVQGCAPFIE